MTQHMAFSSDDDALEFLKRYGHEESRNGVIRGDWRCFDADCRAAVNYLCDEWDFVFEDTDTAIAPTEGVRPSRHHQGADTMSRPTILDMDLVVVPREANKAMMPHTHAGRRSYSAMLSASPYPTAWDDVRKYVEGLEQECEQLKANIDRLTSNPADHRYWEGRWRDSEARIAELEKRLADADRVVEPFSLIVTEGIAKRNDAYTSITTCTDYFRAARAYMEGK